MLTRLRRGLSHVRGSWHLPFRDLSRAGRRAWEPSSPVLCFYSHYNNVGNYTPNLGMRRMLDFDFDYWSMHDLDMDLEYINRTYTCAVVGGAGLLHGAFEPFWELLAKECRLPVIIWGVGACAPSDRSARPVHPGVVARLRERIELVNVRDDLSADIYGFEPASISPCPTVVWLAGMERRPPRHTLIVEHEHLVGRSLLEEVRTAVEQSSPQVATTDHRIRRRWPWSNGALDLVEDTYAPAGLVVSTRLHGVIIAYGLGIPYIAISRDEKIDSFSCRYGNGRVVHSIGELRGALSEPPTAGATIEIDSCLAFGDRVAEWMASRGIEVGPDRLSGSRWRTVTGTPRLSET